MKHAPYLILLCAFAADSIAGEVNLGGSDPFSSPAILPVDDAFRADRLQTDEALEVRFTMPPGYYLYRHAFELTDDTGETRSFSVPAGLQKTDEFFGDVEVYYDEVIVEVPLALTGGITTLRYQGCADAGYCYPPKTMSLDTAMKE